MIDASKYHDASKAPELVAQAIKAAGSQGEVAKRCDLSREYLRQLASGRKTDMSYGVQVMLEGIAAESKTPALLSKRRGPC